MITVTIQIGNTDNKLRQVEWSHYVEEMRLVIEEMAHEVHFFGGSPNWYPWQNVAWVVLTDEKAIGPHLDKVTEVRKRYNQDSVAITEGETKFI